jgi:hypothetical protein
MNKATIIIGILALVLIGSAIAYTPLNYRERCEIVQSATEYRPERSFGMIGIWGRTSNGEAVCFIPRSKPKITPVVEATPEPTPEPICHDVTTCNWGWVKEWDCDYEWTCHHQCWKTYNWHFEEVCEWDWNWKKTCNTHQVCEE